MTQPADADRRIDDLIHVLCITRALAAKSVLQPLLGLVERGLTREEAYALVQRNAMRAWDEERPLGELLGDDAEVTAVLPAEDLAELLDPAWYTRHVPELMQRVASL